MVTGSLMACIGDTLHQEQVTKVYRPCNQQESQSKPFIGIVRTCFAVDSTSFIHGLATAFFSTVTVNSNRRCPIHHAGAEPAFK
jgi:hypothetical protein